MHQYILDTEYAVRGLIDLITVEEKQLSQLQNKYGGLSSKAKYLNQQLMDAPFNDNVDPLREQGIAIDSHRTHEELTNLQKQIVALQASIDAKSVSINVLCGAVLQIAKQGISIVYGHLSQCPDGRSIGIEKLKNVIWQARNQSMHYEEGDFKQPVIDCFANLESSLGNQFSLSLNRGKNLAHDVIEELGWKDYSIYESDLKSLNLK
jgi:hypothetical protein